MNDSIRFGTHFINGSAIIKFSYRMLMQDILDLRKRYDQYITLHTQRNNYVRIEGVMPSLMYHEIKAELDIAAANYKISVQNNKIDTLRRNVEAAAADFGGLI